VPLVDDELADPLLGKDLRTIYTATDATAAEVLRLEEGAASLHHVRRGANPQPMKPPRSLARTAGHCPAA
jgi:hypothetical protein